MAGEVRAEKVNLISEITTEPPKMLFVESGDPVPNQSTTGDGYIKKIAISDLVYRKSETYSKSETDTKLNAKQNIIKPIKITDVTGGNPTPRTITYDGNAPLTISAGNNISFAGCNAELFTISATNTAYTQGPGITISGNTISASTSYLGSILKGSGTTTFLAANGTWQTPPSGGGAKCYVCSSGGDKANNSTVSCNVGEVLFICLQQSWKITINGGYYIGFSINANETNPYGVFVTNTYTGLGSGSNVAYATIVAARMS